MIKGPATTHAVGRLLLLALLALVTVLVAVPVAAQETPEPDDAFWDNATCYSCHEQSGLTVELPSRERLNLAVFESNYEDSTHGEFGVACRNCHADITGFPHPVLTAANRAEFTAGLAGSCEICHRDHYTVLADEIHGGELACSNCHDPHTTGTSSSIAAAVQLNCNGCHPAGAPIPEEGIHAFPEVPERHQSTSGLTILLFLIGGFVGFIVLVWLIVFAIRVVRERT